MREQLRTVQTSLNVINAAARSTVASYGGYRIVVLPDFDDLSDGTATIGIVVPPALDMTLIGVGPTLWEIANIDGDGGEAELFRYARSAKPHNGSIVLKSIDLSRNPWRGWVREHAATHGRVKVGLKDRISILTEDCHALLRALAENGVSTAEHAQFARRWSALLSERDRLLAEIGEASDLLDLVEKTRSAHAYREEEAVPPTS